MATTVTEVIKQLEDVLRKYGDIAVYRPHDGTIVPVVYVTVVRDPERVQMPNKSMNVVALIK